MSVCCHLNDTDISNSFRPCIGSSDVCGSVFVQNKFCIDDRIFFLKLQSVFSATLVVNYVSDICMFVTGRPLFYVSLHLFRQHNFIELFRLDFVKLMNLFCKFLCYYNCLYLF